MYVPLRDDSGPINIKLPWNKYTARGFLIALVIAALILLLIPVFRVDTLYMTRYEINKVPIEFLNFGNGDGTGASKGNLTEEGMKHKGKNPQTDLNDAEIAAKANTPKVILPRDAEDASKFVTVKELGSKENGATNNRATGSENIGAKDGDDLALGLGDKGIGAGSGMGLGDIEWGGGGNRIVLHKKIPKYPPGVNTGAKIRIMFTVNPDGTVMRMVPLQKGDPILEKSAMDALRQWRFNPLNSNVEMQGIITFTFKVS
ncbi:MAG: TonB family protein [Ignavibacteriae bacterium]|nr:TonB family protein [Ignavibacteriota bacterium]